jgi:hypothetical protein
LHRAKVIERAFGKGERDFAETLPKNLPEALRRSALVPPGIGR